MKQAPPIGDHAPRRWPTVVAIGWLSAFCIFYYSLTPPNNPGLRRYEVWPQVPFVLMDAVDPPDDAGGPPSGWTYLPQRFDLLLTAAIILAGAWGAGHLALRWIRFPLEPRCAERTLFAFALGLASLSLLTLLSGLIGVLSPVLFAAILFCALFGEWALRIGERRRLNSPAKAASGEMPDADSVTPAAKGLMLAAMSPFLLAMLLGSLLPSTDFDVREYHLQGPKEFYQAGRIEFLPHNVYTSFPFLTEMLSLLAMVLRGDWYRGALAGKAVLMCFGPLTGFALYVAGRRWFSPSAGWLAALVYLTMPWTFRISTIAYAEGGLTFYLFAALLAFGIAVEELRRESAAPNRLFLLCGLLAGCAMACKYTGIVSVVIPLFAATCVAPFIAPPIRLRLSGPHKHRLAMFLLGTALTIGPWLIKNLVETGNPVYPLMYTLFGGRDWDAELNAKWRAGHSPPNYTDLPERLLEVTAANDWLTPLLFGLAPLSLLWVCLWCRRLGCNGQAGRPHHNPQARRPHHNHIPQARRPHHNGGGLHRVGFLWLYVLWLFATWWTLTHRIDRFWVPMTPVIALLASIGGTAVRDGKWLVVRHCWIAAAILFNLALVVSGASGNNTFLIDLQRAQHVPPGIEFLNGELPPRSRVLMVGEAQVFDARFPLVYNTVFDHSIFEQWTAAETPAVPHAELPLRGTEEIRRTLRDAGITHVYVNWQEILRYRTTYGYTDFVTPDRFQALVQRGVLRSVATLAVVRDEALLLRVQAGGEPFQPARYAAAGGGETIVYGVRGDFSADEQRQLQQWGQSLLPRERDRPLFVTGRIYEVQQ